MRNSQAQTGPFQLTTSRIGNLYAVDPYSAIRDDHTYMHTLVLLYHRRKMGFDEVWASSPSSEIIFFVCLYLTFSLDVLGLSNPAGSKMRKNGNQQGQSLSTRFSPSVETRRRFG